MKTVSVVGISWRYVYDSIDHGGEYRILMELISGFVDLEMVSRALQPRTANTYTSNIAVGKPPRSTGN
jgi:hypothetical protein